MVGDDAMMESSWLRFPALSLKAKLVLFIVVLLALTLGAVVLVSLQTQEAIVSATQEKVKDLTEAIRLSVQELTAVNSRDRSSLQRNIENLRSKGFEVSIASSEYLILNSSDPKLIGLPLKPKPNEFQITRRLGRETESLLMPSFHVIEHPKQAYLIPVVVEDHPMGYIVVTAEFGDLTAPVAENRTRLVTLASAIFAIGIVFSYFLADRYVRPIHTIAEAAQNIAARGLEPVPEGRRRDEIGLLIRSFNEMLRQLSRARERELELNRLERFTALGQLAGGLAHEIKNPLNFISLAVDQLRARYASQITNDRETFMRQVGMVKDEIRRLSELIQSFLVYGRPVEIHPAPTDLRAVVLDVLALSESRLKSQGIEVTQDGFDNPAVLNVDSEKIRTCFVNVVANATQAMPDGGTLQVGFHQDNGTLAVSFADTGQGIEPEVVQHVFEPFFTTKREGIGIGLFMSKAIVEKHGGTITIGPNQGDRGTLVTFTFPAAGPHRQL